MGWRAGLERGEGGQTACQGGRGGQDPTRGATSVFQHCSLREFALCGRRTGADGVCEGCLLKIYLLAYLKSRGNF